MSDHASARIPAGKEHKVQLAARLLLGLLFAVFGLNGFVGFIPVPPPAPEAGAFLGALAATGYMFPMVKGLELLAGLALLAGVYVPLALLVLIPIVVNIVALHLFLDPSGLVMPLAILALGIVVATAHWARFRQVLQAR